MKCQDQFLLHRNGQRQAREREKETVRMRNETAVKCVNKDKRSAEHNERELSKMLTHGPKAVSLVGDKGDTGFLFFLSYCSAVKTASRT